MTEPIQLFLALGILIGFAKALGYIALRLQQPAVLGELLAGILIGPSVIDLLGNPFLFPNGEGIRHIIVAVGEIGVLLLMFTAGLEIDPQSMFRVGRPAVLAGLLGVAVPILVMTPIIVLFDYSPEKALFIGILFASMSTSISAQVMLELGVLDRRAGLTMLGAALVDDAVVILLLSLFLAINPGEIITIEDTRSVGEVLLRLGGFLIIGSVISWFLLPPLVNWISRLPISQGTLMFAIVITLLLSVAAEYFGGIAAIAGAFLAGVCLRRARHDVVQDIEDGVRRINYSFFVPLFFISIGLQSNLRLLTAELLPFALVMTALAIVTKVIGAGGGSKLGGFDRLDSMRVGLGMISRGEVGLIIASIGISLGIMEPEIFAAVVFVVLVTTLITPPLVRWSFSQKDSLTQINEGAASHVT